MVNPNPLLMSQSIFDHPVLCAIEHLQGRGKALEPLGWTGGKADWIALACLDGCGIFT